MVGKTNTRAKYSTCIGTRYENAFVNNFETHGASYIPNKIPRDFGPVTAFRAKFPISVARHAVTERGQRNVGP